MSQNNSITLPVYQNATGPLNITLVNDYLFRELLQKNNKVLKSLIASLLHMKEEEIRKVEITNPMKLSDSPDGKDFILDIIVNLNDDTSLNLEMQVINRQNWVERSISYLCRCADSLAKGADYGELKTAIQIGLLDYTLFPDAPEFYASYYLMNEKNQRRYSSKLRISVLDLTKIDIATVEDKSFGIDFWARLFKATTWEDLKMLAEKSEAMEAAVSTVYEITQDEEALQRIRAREEKIAEENRIMREKAQAEADVERLSEALRLAVKALLKAKTPQEVATELGMNLSEIQAIAEE